MWFLVRGENRSTRGKTSHSRVENQQTQSTYDGECGNRTRATLVEVLSPLGQPCHPKTKNGKLNTLFKAKIPKNIPWLAAHPHLALTREYPPPQGEFFDVQKVTSRSE